MRSVRLDVRTGAPEELVDLTERVRAEVARAGLRDGAVLVACPHTTAAVIVQENADPDVRRDLLLALRDAVPDRPRSGGAWRHAEGNAPAHVKAALLGHAQLVPVEGGALQLGTWQAVYLCELDGPRSRHVLLRFLADAS